MKKSKILLLGLIAGISFIGFSSASLQEFRTLYADRYQNSYCFYPSFDSSDGDYYLKQVSGVSNFRFIELNGWGYSFGSLIPQRSYNSFRVGRMYDYISSVSDCPVFVLLKDIPLLPGKVNSLSPVITSISSLIIEFIPYIVYIGIGILGALIGFYAIRWFINWLRKKIFSSFK